MTILFRPQGAFGWFSYTTSRDTIAGTQNEDTAPLNLYDRSTNWHFYNREGRLRPWALGNRSLDLIFAKRAQALEIALRGESNINDVYHRAGQVLHYIQDMSVPPM